MGSTWVLMGSGMNKITQLLCVLIHPHMQTTPLLIIALFVPETHTMHSNTQAVHVLRQFASLKGRVEVDTLGISP